MTATRLNQDQFHATGKQIYFLVGIPRSGTTWLQSMLASHPEIGSSQESHLFNHCIGPLLQRWDDLLQFEDGRGGIGLPCYLTQQQFEEHLNRLAYEVLSNAGEFVDSPVFVEKTPDHITQIDNILRIIPSARFIYLERNKYDVIESLLSAGKGWGRAWAPRSVISAICLFNSYRKQGQAALQRLPADKVITLRYEHLKTRPNTCLTWVLDFMGLDASPAILEQMRRQRAPLHRQGEFALRNGEEVLEPEGFQRKTKPGLSWLQRLLITLICRAT